MVKQNVRGEIDALEISADANFPIERYEYVLSCRTKLAKATGKIFVSNTYVDDLKKARVKITRTA
jgi:hypothetical protein